MADDPPTLEGLAGLPDTDLADRANRYFKLSEAATDAAFFPVRGQILMQEMARRSQDRQTKSIIAMTKAMAIMTAAITLMTLAILVATIWPDWLRAAVDSLWIRASQVIDLWWPRG